VREWRAHTRTDSRCSCRPCSFVRLQEGGDRNADVFTGTDECGCILAILTYNDLDNISEMERYAPLARKLRNLFATASIKKLRAMINNAKSSSSVASVADVPAPAPAPTSASTDAPARETLFQTKLPQGSSAAATPKPPAVPTTPVATAAPSGAAVTKVLEEMQRTLSARDATIVELLKQVEELTFAASASAAPATATATVAAAAHATAPASAVAPVPAVAPVTARAAASKPAKVATPVTSPATSRPASKVAVPSPAAKPKVAMKPAATAAVGAKTTPVKKPTVK
jgi:hypothetical protein